MREKFGKSFLGFLMLGGMSGGGMGFLFDPGCKSEAQGFLQELMSTSKRDLQHSLPFAMEPVVYDFSINDHGTVATLMRGRRRVVTRPILCDGRTGLGAVRYPGTIACQRERK